MQTAVEWRLASKQASMVSAHIHTNLTATEPSKEPVAIKPPLQNSFRMESCRIPASDPTCARGHTYIHAYIHKCVRMPLPTYASTRKCTSADTPAGWQQGPHPRARSRTLAHTCCGGLSHLRQL
eukprot:GHVU01019311.1.p4 GENE.GHVU01019311.1~~GHVU01019311.1.p4  ORF type:complete len:124 (-),score=8.50 GHVU01019311.1:578-949(-)